MRFSWSIAVLVFGACLPAPAQIRATPDAQGPATSQESSYVPVHKFDEKRDAAADIQAAIKEARRTGKRVLVDIGGDWCQYCHEMDQLFQEHPELLELREKNFITVAVYYGSGKKNEQIPSSYPKVEGIPHYYVLEKDGSVLHSQHLVELRHAGKYSPDKMKDFLTKWSPSPAETAAKAD